MSPLMFRRVLGAMIRWRWALLVLAAALGLVGAIVGSRLTLDRSIEKMFQADDPLLVPFERMKRTFGEHEIVMALYADPELASEAGLARVERLAARMREVPGVVAVVSLLEPPGASDFADAGRGARFRDMFAGYTHNASLDGAGVICLIERAGVGPTTRRETLARMRSAAADYDAAVLVGEPILVEEAFDLLERDGKLLNSWCTALVLAVILACFRRLTWLALPLATVWLALALTRGLLAASQLQLSMVSSMLGAIVTVVGVATVVHVMVRYQASRQRGLAPRRALLTTLEQLAVPVTFACLTDAAGFGALVVSRVGPGHDFGLMMALGSLLVLPSCALAAPSLTLAGGARDVVAPPAPDAARGWLVTGLEALLAWSTRHARLLIAGFGIAAVLAGWGTRRLELETDFTRNFRAGSSIVQAYEFVENRFGGAGVWDLMIPAPERVDGRWLAELVDREAAWRAANPNLGKAISLADALAAGLGSSTALRRAPTFALAAGMRLMRARMVEFVEAIDNVDPETGRRWLRVLLRSPEQLPAAEKAELIAQTTAAVRADYPEAEATGYYVLLTRLVESLLADQWTTFAVAAGVVLAMLAAAFRSVPLALAAVVPNMAPSLVLFGAMGWLGIRVNMGAAMIAAVSVGLSVDGSIHYVMLYQRLRRRGASVSAALVQAQDLVGRAATFATLALIVGFAALALSDFVPTAYFGVLVSLSMVGGLVGNLTVLPMLIAALSED